MKKLKVESEKRRRPNFEWLTESPEALAEALVYSDEDEWHGEQFLGLTADGIRE